MEHKKNLIISHILKYSSAQYFSQFLGFFTSVIMKRILGPVYIGIWSILKVVIDYASYANLGTGAAVSYKLPVLKGQGADREAQDLTSVVFNFVSITTFICSLGVFIYALAARNTLRIEMFIGLLAVSVILLTHRVYTYYMLLMRANKDFTILSKSVVFDAIANLCLIILIVTRFKLYGFYFVAIMMPVLNVLFIRRYITYDLKFSLNLKGIYPAIRYGFPLFLVVIFDQILNSVDRIMIGSMLGFEQLGFYSIGLMAKSYGTGVSKNFIIVIQPYFLGDFNKDDVSKSSRYVGIYTQVTAYFMAILLSLVFIVAPLFVTAVLPQFAPGITALRIFLLATFFFTIVSYPNDLLVALEKQFRLIPIVVAAIFINIILNYAFIKRGFGINGVSSATVISAFLSFLVTSVYALKHSESFSRILGYLAKSMLPLFYCLILLGGLNICVRTQDLLVGTIVQMFVFSVLVIPLLWYLNRETGVIKTIFTILTRRFKSA